MMNKPKVAILGFGLLGRVTALMLHDKAHLNVYEASDEHASNSAGALAAAMLAPLAESVICEADLAQLGLQSMAMWPSLLAKLPDPVFFQQAGTLVVAHTQDKGDLNSFSQRLKPLEGHTAYTVGSAQIHDLEPELEGRFHQGLYLSCEGQLDNLAFYRSSFAYLQNSDVQFNFNHKIELSTTPSEPVLIDGHQFDWVIDCRGLGAQTESSDLRGVRGEVARVYAPEVELNRPVRLMHPRYPIYIAPKPNHEFVIGATEIESQDNGPITVRSTLELLSAAYTVHSGFAEARVMAMNAGLRPAFSDNRPRVERNGNVIRINGLYRHGYLLAPAVVSEALSKGLL
ncbi:FAD-dependent oxidoreductase [Pseudoalteromonas aurantia]|uniref:D-amino-acid oxidase n=2 Tax=Pseudoalteromonas aurantia TaxID=43654 RepID=A0ABY2VY92_9GAMM|nr:FAD-dependent oxidoreductase [Pseudoalteromonas aurantia]TMO74794.1 FAD-dependent oxidoreductase [Pseudoalteromonas aurantia]